MQIPMEIVLTIFGLIIGLVSWFVKRELKRIDDNVRSLNLRVDSQNKITTGIEKNYLIRFDEVKTLINDQKDEITKTLKDEIKAAFDSLKEYMNINTKAQIEVCKNESHKQISTRAKK